MPKKKQNRDVVSLNGTADSLNGSAVSILFSQ